MRNGESMSDGKRERGGKGRGGEREREREVVWIQ